LGPDVTLVASDVASYCGMAASVSLFLQLSQSNLLLSSIIISIVPKQVLHVFIVIYAGRVYYVLACCGFTLFAETFNIHFDHQFMI
jgi:hypothetical protein